jgi:hypothetical protein
VKTEPQFSFPSLNRILNEWYPVSGIFKLFENICSIELLKSPSKAAKTVPFPSPGSLSQKYSANERETPKLKVFG